MITFLILIRKAKPMLNRLFKRGFDLLERGPDELDGLDEEVKQRLARFERKRQQKPHQERVQTCRKKCIDEIKRASDHGYPFLWFEIDPANEPAKEPLTEIAQRTGYRLEELSIQAAL